MSSYSTSIIFKKATTKKELIDVFKLRYLAYKKMGFINLNGATNHLEFDSFDYYSIHGIAYRIDPDCLLPIGTIRIIIDRINKESEPIIDSLTKIIQLDFRPTKNRPYALPALSTFRLNGFLEKLNKRNRKVCEIGRLAVHPDYWGNGVGLHKGLHDFATAIVYGKSALTDETNTFMQDWILLCHPKHESAYERLGFSRIYNTGIKLIDKLKTLAIAMHGSRESSLKPAFNRSKDKIEKLHYDNIFCKCNQNCADLNWLKNNENFTCRCSKT